jgi:hypothetical protein
MGLTFDPTDAPLKALTDKQRLVVDAVRGSFVFQMEKASPTSDVNAVLAVLDKELTPHIEHIRSSLDGGLLRSKAAQSEILAKFASYERPVAAGFGASAWMVPAADVPLAASHQSIAQNPKRLEVVHVGISVLGEPSIAVLFELVRKPKCAPALGGVCVLPNAPGFVADLLEICLNTLAEQPTAHDPEAQM